MSAEPIDPVAVREARKRLEAVRPNVITRDQFGNDVSGVIKPKDPTNAP